MINRESGVCSIYTIMFPMAVEHQGCLEMVEELWKYFGYLGVAGRQADGSALQYLKYLPMWLSWMVANDMRHRKSVNGSMSIAHPIYLNFIP